MTRDPSTLEELRSSEEPILSEARSRVIRTLGSRCGGRPYSCRRLWDVNRAAGVGRGASGGSDS